MYDGRSLCSHEVSAESKAIDRHLVVKSPPPGYLDSEPRMVGVSGSHIFTCVTESLLFTGGLYEGFRLGRGGVGALRLFGKQTSLNSH